MQDLEHHAEEAVAMRRTLHRRPEEGWSEFESTWRIVTALEAMGLPVHCGREVIDPAHVLGRDEELVSAAEARAREAGVPQAFLERLGHYTGAVAELDTGRPGPVTALRFDIDCVLVEESESPDHPPAACGFASTRHGFMHACGHDAHTAVGLALAHWAVEHKDALSGRIRFLFQPAEEGTRGAGAMAAAGVVDDADFFFGSHVGGPCRPGEVGLIRHGYFATTKIDVEFEGVPAHAGGNPELGRSALSAAAAATLQFEGITRHSGGDTRVAVGTLHAGEGRNVVPVHAKMQLEVRGATKAVSDWMVGRVDAVVRGVSESYEVKGSWRRAGEADSMDSDPEAGAVVEKAALENGLAFRVFDEAGGSEDCSLLMRRAQARGAKAAFFLWGCRHGGHHKPLFDVQDEENLPRAIAVFASILKTVNAR